MTPTENPIMTSNNITIDGCDSHLTGWPTIQKSNVAKRTTNPIRNVVDRLSVPPNPTLPMISLGLGDPTVFGNLPPPPQVIQAVRNALDSGKFHGYPPAIGYEIARTAVAQRYNHTLENGPVSLTANDVIITSGCSGALEMAFGVLAQPGQTILLPQPGFSLYRTLCDNKDIRVKYYRLLPERNWEVDLQQVEEILKCAKESNEGVNTPPIAAWLINNPSNPCGSVYSQEHLQECKRLAARYHITIIADEIYEDMVFAPNQFHPLASLSPYIPMITCGGLAKRFLVPGWRLGWILLNEGTVRGSLAQVRAGLIDLAGLILGANSVIQGALPEIFTLVPSSFHEQTNNYIARNAAIIYDHLNGTPGLRLIRPQGAFYMMVGLEMGQFDLTDDVQVCERLISEESVVCLPGVIFGMPNYIRLVYCAHPEKIAEACDRIKRFFKRHCRQGRFD